MAESDKPERSDAIRREDAVAILLREMHERGVKIEELKAALATKHEQEAETTNAAVHCDEALGIKVGKWLLDKGFLIGDNIGFRIDPGDHTEIGILLRPTAPPKRYFFGLLEECRQYAFPAVLWLANSPRRAHWDNWVLEVRGRMHLEPMRKVAEELSSAFNVGISVRLIDEKPDYTTNYEISREWLAGFP